jgi:putative endonuclease
MFFVYILQNDIDGSFYVGQTQNIRDRLKRHNENRSLFTKDKGTWSLVHLEKFNSSSEAVKREKDIKKKKSKKYIEYLVRTSRSDREGRPATAGSAQELV